MHAAGVESQKDLAHFLGISRGRVSDAVRRGAVPHNWLVKLQEEKGVNPKWILNGQEPVYLGSSFR